MLYRKWHGMMQSVLNKLTLLTKPSWINSLFFMIKLLKNLWLQKNRKHPKTRVWKLIVKSSKTIFKIFTFFVFDRKRPSWANLVQIVSIYSFFCFWSEMSFLGENLVQNVKIISLKLNLFASLIRICRIQRQCSLFSFLIGNAFFWANLVQNVKIFLIVETEKKITPEGNVQIAKRLINNKTKKKF